MCYLNMGGKRFDDPSTCTVGSRRAKLKQFVWWETRCKARDHHIVTVYLLITKHY
jgi:hypothetical protein